MSTLNAADINVGSSGRDAALVHDCKSDERDLDVITQTGNSFWDNCDTSDPGLGDWGWDDND
jgi:hypothetical protein